MKIALIYDRLYPSSVGGAELRLYELAKRLGKFEQVTVYGDDAWLHDPASRLPHCGYKVLHHRPNQNTKRRNWLSPIAYTLSLLRSLFTSQEEIWDIISFPYFHIPFVRALAAVRGKKLVVTWIEYWGDYWDQVLPPGLAALGRLVETIALRNSPRLVAISQHTRNRLVAAGASESKVELVECGIDFLEIQSICAASESSSLISIGRLIPHKRFDLAIRTLAKLPVSHTLTLIGDGPERKKLEELAKNLNVESRVRFKGFIEDHRDVLAHLKSAGVLLQPSEREGFGMTLTESWACGVPAVVCQGPFNASASLVSDPKLGSVATADPDSLAAACAAHLMSGGANKEFCKTHAQNYDWAKITAALLKVYKHGLG